MDDGDFEGTLVLEALAQRGRLDEFATAVDSDDFDAAADLMRAAGIDDATVAVVIRKMVAGGES